MLVGLTERKAKLLLCAWSLNSIASRTFWSRQKGRVNILCQTISMSKVNNDIYPCSINLTSHLCSINPSSQVDEINLHVVCLQNPE